MHLSKFYPASNLFFNQIKPAVEPLFATVSSSNCMFVLFGFILYFPPQDGSRPPPAALPKVLLSQESP